MSKNTKKPEPNETPKFHPLAQESVGQGAPANVTPSNEEQPAADVTQLMQELEQTRQQASENFEGWQRERADFANYKKRIERDQAQLANFITGEIVRKYLVILDDLERALKTLPAEGEGTPLADGIELIYRKVQKILEAEGLTPIPVEQFNPTYHEAISHEDCPDCESGEIIAVVQQGYQLGERVIRPALVRVAR
ncbi:MAG: nucleotide exchange factor GrpE [Anaerolineaceae bacterium]|nr:nucleotide exchange factor GrpE [Anaerolineaceae bacterium]